MLSSLLLLLLLCMCACSDGYPNTEPLQDAQRAKEIVEVLMQNYLEATDDQQSAPPAIMPFEEFYSPVPVVPSLVSATTTSSSSSTTVTVPTLTNETESPPPPPPRSLSIDSQLLQSTAAIDDEDTAPAASLKSVERRYPMGLLDPGSLTLTLIIVAAVICTISLITLTAFSLWQWRRRQTSSQWVVGKAKLPAYQGDAWCYENVSASTTGGNTTNKRNNRDSVYLAGATLKPYDAYTVDSSPPTSNGTTRSSILSDCEIHPSPYFDGWTTTHGQPYREKLVN